MTGYSLRELRTGTGLSQAQLARLAGVARSTLSAYESGHRTPSPAIAESTPVDIVSGGVGATMDRILAEAVPL